MVDLSQKKHTDWETVLLAIAKRPGVTMFLGASDTGKTTCLRVAAAHLARAGLLPLAIVDADLGQSTIGPPTTVGLTLVTKENVPALLSGRLACHAMRFVGALVGEGTVPQLKPDPAPLLHCLDRLGADETSALYVGDSEIDAETAFRAKVPFALFSGGYLRESVDAFEPVYVFDHFDDLSDYVLQGVGRR